jgi:apolipoprotein N-acyltransferase
MEINKDFNKNNNKLLFIFLNLLLILSIFLIVISFYFIGYNYFIFIAYVPLFFYFYKINKEKFSIKCKVFLFYFLNYFFLSIFINKITSYVKVMYFAFFGLVLTLTFLNYFIFYLIYFSFLIYKKIKKIEIIDIPLIFIISQIVFELIMFKGELSFPWFNISLPAAYYPKFISISSIFGNIFVSIFILMINYYIFVIILRIYSIIFNLKIFEKDIKKDENDNIYYNINLNISRQFIKTSKNILFKELKTYFFILFLLISFPFFWYIFNPFTKVQKTDLKITIAQHNYPLNFKFRYEYFPKMIKKIIISNDLLKNETDLIIWSESSYPDFFMESFENKKELQKSALKNNIGVIIGFPYYENGKYYNTAGYINKRGEINIYKKIHLVPFGEFIPFSDKLKFLEKIAPEVGISNSKGDFIKPFEISKNGNDGTYKFYPTICFEGIYSYLFYKMKKKGAQFFINITNDSYYSNTYQVKQHLYLQVFRAIEFNSYIYRASSTGISAIINNRGEIIQSIGENISGYITNNIYITKSKTIYEIFGFKFILILRSITIFYIIFSTVVLIIFYFSNKIGKTEKKEKNL